ncbi:hypothetical protein UlMin_006949 [Ulmus minor]
MSSPKAPLKSEGFLATSKILVQPSFSWFMPSGTPTAKACRKIRIVVDLSNRRNFSIKWEIHNYRCPRGTVELLHMSPISILYGADWGATDVLTENDEESQMKVEENFNAFTIAKPNDLAQQPDKAQIPYKIHIRLGLCAIVMGSGVFGASKRSPKGMVRTVSDYCVHNSVFM